MAKRRQDLDESGTPIPLPTLPELPVLDRDDALNDAIARMAKVQAQRKALAADEEQLESQIMRSIFARYATEYEIPGVVKAVVRTKETRTIKAAKLVAFGVDPATITAATDVTTSDPWVQLYAKKVD